MSSAYSQECGASLAGCSARPCPASCSSAGNAPGDIGRAGRPWERRGADTLLGPTEHPRSPVASQQGGNGRSRHLSERGSPEARQEGSQPHGWHNSHLHPVNTLFLSSLRAFPQPVHPKESCGWLLWGDALPVASASPRQELFFFFPRESPPQWVRAARMDTWEHELSGSAQ